jgi:hypothetical protein
MKSFSTINVFALKNCTRWNLWGFVGLRMYICETVQLYLKRLADEAAAAERERAKAEIARRNASRSYLIHTQIHTHTHTHTYPPRRDRERVHTRHRARYRARESSVKFFYPICSICVPIRVVFVYGLHNVFIHRIHKKPQRKSLR